MKPRPHNGAGARDATWSANVAGMSNRLAEAERQAGDLVRFGIVESVDLDAGRCVVAIGEIMSPPLPWLTPRAGEDVVWDPPSKDEQVSVISVGGDLSAGLVLIGVLSDSVLDQLGDARGRAVFFRRFRDGSTVLFDPDASELAIELAATGKARIIAKGGIELEGDVSIKGDVRIDGKAEATGDVVGKGVSLSGHVHDKTQPGQGMSGKPVG